MLAFRIRALRSVAIALGLVAAIAVSGGLIRLLPWLLSPRVGLGPSLPFARLVAASAFEASVLIGAPAGFATAAALFVERGEFRAVAALGASPLRLVRSLWVVHGLVLSIALLSVTAAPGAPPGRFVQSVIDSARARCAEPTAPAQVDVPLFDASFLCFPVHPRLVGSLPASRAWFTAKGLTLADDVRRAELDEVSVVADASGTVVSVHVGHAVVTGLPGWGSGKLLRGFFRGIVIGVSTLLLSLVATERTLARSLSPPVAVVAAIVASVSGFQVLRWLDSREPFGVVYVALPVVSALVFVAVTYTSSLLTGLRIARVRAG